MSNEGTVVTSRAWGRRLRAAADAALLVAVILAAGTMVRREWLGHAPGADMLPGISVPDWRDRIPNGSATYGVDSTVVVVLFTDYQCPTCRQMHDYLMSTLARFGRRMTLVTAHFPLPQHPRAVAAANAAECARMDGRFLQMSEQLYRHQSHLLEIRMDSLARLAGVGDIPRYLRCISSRDTLPIVAAGIAAARNLGLRGTPSLIVDGVLLASLPPAERLTEYFQRVMNRPVRQSWRRN
jgi:protein-disulfide isomerase